MLFWITVGIGILMGLLGLKLRWFEAMALLFNLLIGTYLGLYATPIVAAVVPAAVEMPYGMVLTSLCVTLIGFGILQTITYLFITGQFSVYFPKALDLPGGGICGFLAGFLVFSLASILIDVQANPNAKQLPTDQVSTQAGYLEWWTNQVHRFAGNKGTSMDDAIEDLKKLIQAPAFSDPNEDTAEDITAKANTSP